VHLRVLARSRRVRLVVVADPSSEARERARRIADVLVTDDAQEAIDREDVAAVVICAGTDQHAALALSTVRAGKHLYLEKPLAAALAEGEQLVAASEGSGVIAAIGFNRRYHPLFARARALVAEGEIEARPVQAGGDSEGVERRAGEARVPEGRHGAVQRVVGVEATGTAARLAARILYRHA